jgi:hypothetical protein
MPALSFCYSFQSFKSGIVCALLLLFLFCCPVAGRTQDSSFLAVSYIKLKDPAKGAEYEANLKYYTTKVIGERIKDGSVRGWYLWKALMPSGTGAEYDYMIAISSNSLQMLLDDTSGAANFQRAMPGMGEPVRQAVGSNFNELRTITKKELYRNVAALDMTTPPKYAEVSVMKVMPGKYAAYRKMEQETFGAIQRERMRLGAISGWQFYEMLLPYADGAPEFFTVNYLTSLPQLMNPQWAPAVKAAWPKTDINKLFTDVEANRKTVRSNLLKLVMVIDNSTVNSLAGPAAN